MEKYEMNITWKVTQLDRRASDGYVITAHWTAVAEDGGLSAVIYSTCSWPEGTPEIPFDSLTEAQVLEWVWANGVDKEATEAALAAQIELQRNPPVVHGIPW